MEDAHTQLLSLNNDKSSAFFAVYDGHGGILINLLNQFCNKLTNFLKKPNSYQIQIY
jgi:serine/threonine protein phosphatase PrpC